MFLRNRELKRYIEIFTGRRAVMINTRSGIKEERYFCFKVFSYTSADHKRRFERCPYSKEEYAARRESAFAVKEAFATGSVQKLNALTDEKEITTEKDAPTLTILFGEQEKRDWNKEDIDWNAIDSKLISKHIIVTRPEINGKKLGSLRLRNTYGINISRVLRSGVQLLATPGLVLQLGDRLTVVGEAAAIQNVEKVLGNTVKTLKDPNLASIFIGIILGLIVGSIPIAIPGISSPVKLGLAGGPIVIGILIGAYGPRLHLVTYTTRSANLMLRGIGLSLYLACLGLDAGAHFFETVMRPEGALWVGIGFLITFIPVVIMALVSLRLCKMDFGNTCGMLCGSMANPMALNYANDIIPGDEPSVSYATVYPLGMFTRVIIAQLVLMLFL